MKLRVGAALGALIGLVLLSLTTRGSAHDRTTSYSKWEVVGRTARVVLTLADLDIDGSTVKSMGVQDYAVQRLTLSSEGTPCPVLGTPRSRQGPPGRQIIEWTVRCRGEERFEVRSQVLLEQYPGHLHFVTIDRHAEDEQAVLTRDAPAYRIPDRAAAAGAPTPWYELGAEYWSLGVEHIATGYDHLVFLLALLLGGSALGSTIKVVSGFTIGHSLTLVLASLRFVEASIGPIEAVIGMSIAFVALENVWVLRGRGWTLPAVLAGALAVQGILAACSIGQVSWLSCAGMVAFVACYYALARRDEQSSTNRWALATVFGLIHGFGFASVLKTAQLPQDDLLVALAGFSFGVESGQVLLVAVVWPALRVAAARVGEVIVELGSSVALSLGVFWWIQRTYG